MTPQEQYDAAQLETDSKAGAYIDEVKARYQELKAAGASTAKLAVAKAAFFTMIHTMTWLCDSLNVCAGTVPGVQPLSGGGPKRDDNIESNP